MTMPKPKPVTPGAGRNKGVAHSGLLLSDDRQAIERSQNDPVLKLPLELRTKNFFASLARPAFPAPRARLELRTSFPIPTIPHSTFRIPHSFPDCQLRTQNPELHRQSPPSRFSRLSRSPRPFGPSRLPRQPIPSIEGASSVGIVQGRQ